MSPNSRTSPFSFPVPVGTGIRRAALRAACALVCALVLLVGRQALAAGTFTLKTASVEEKDGEWHVKVRIDLPRAPPLMHTPMRFTFSKEAVDERAIMTKGAEPVHHRVVLETTTKQIESMDVDFADPAGKVFRSTYFEFDLERKDGYFEAGEYVVTLASPDGDVGGAQKLTLKGDNPPVYRGAMDFSGDAKTGKPKGPKIQAVSNGLDGGAQEVADNDTPSAGPTSTEVAAEGPAPTMVPQTAYDKTNEESMQEHPKGCGCVAAGAGGSALSNGEAAALLALGMGLLLARRRRFS
jgi:MYXO-CTERM domain-containing protein